MKRTAKILTALVALSMLFSFACVINVSAAGFQYDGFTEYGQKIHDIRSTTSSIVIDGVVSPDEYNCDPIELNAYSEGVFMSNWAINGFPEEDFAEILPASMTYYITYDELGLYIAAEISETSLYADCKGVLADLWGLDCLEIDISLDALQLIPDDMFGHSEMLDRTRITYALMLNEYDRLQPVARCYTPSSYGTFYTDEDMFAENFMITRDENTLITTYEVFYEWNELWDGGVPECFFMNLQLHLADERYLDYVAPGYVGCLGGLRYACILPDSVKSEYNLKNSMVMHVYNLVDDLSGDEETTAPETFDTTAPVVETTEAPTAAETTAPAVPETTVLSTEAETTVPETTAAPAEETTAAPAATTAAEKSGGCGSVVGSVSVMAIVTLLGAAVALKKKDN